MFDWIDETDWLINRPYKSNCSKCGTPLVGRGCPQCQTLQTLMNSLTTETLTKELRAFEAKEIKVKVGKYSCEYCQFKYDVDMDYGFGYVPACSLFHVRVANNKPCKECQEL